MVSTMLLIQPCSHWASRFCSLGHFAKGDGLGAQPVPLTLDKPLGKASVFLGNQGHGVETFKKLYKGGG